MNNTENKVPMQIPLIENETNVLDNFKAFIELVKILRRECPWDRKQSNESIAHLLIEEAYETTDAIYDKDDQEFSKELGDVLLHIVMHSVMAEQRNAFTLTDVIQKIFHKMVHRHPHVFGEEVAKNEEQVMQNWEKLKMKEGKNSVLDGVPNALPSLLRAERIQHKASKVGFDWTDKNEVWKKVEEELLEFKEELNSGDRQKAREELGDLLFSIVNAARHEGIVAEESLQITNTKFTKRFKYIEEKAKEKGKDLHAMTIEEMDELWEEAKIKA